MTFTTPFASRLLRGSLVAATSLTLMVSGALAQDADAAPVERLTEENATVGATYLKEEHGDWEIRCVKTAEGESDPCTIYQLLRDQNGNDIAEFSMFQLPEAGEAAAAGTIVAPLETLLTQGIALAVDGANGKRYPFAFCNTAGCFARVGFTAAEIATFKAGAKAQMVLVPFGAKQGEQVVLELSLTGFTAAYDSSAALNAK